MNLMTLWLDPDVVGFISATFTICLSSTGIWTCWCIISEKSVGTRSYLPFLAGALMSSLWLLYGIVVNDNPMMFVNFIGSVLQSIYFIIFYLFTNDKSVPGRNGLVAVVSVLFIYVTVLNLPQLLQVVVALGFICNAVTIAFFAAPLASMVRTNESIYNNIYEKERE
ncbi:PREDICTED: sugar transporter SWEET1-like [Amphimedon queenslandica]|uniref:Sugar transporter SWEET1 n=1 Tax=Amphimedon queenslandica TaxID=400682 RepID=A0AAN0JFW6_AMPQE|nr:PREDICTED: sugar transporter SWEET1-like [Amphimedon queenslandica]|eukprot:XP_019855696.1 PREDICTED: sugar transporter SWEET1-like [Amphimedon queenslandica]